VVIPAGGTLQGTYRTLAGTPHRALAPIGISARPVLQVVVDALRSSDCTRRIIVVGDQALCKAVTGVDTWLDENEASGTAAHETGSGSNLSGGPANILRGLRELEPGRPAIVCTSDLPFLSGAGISDFLSRTNANSDIAVGLVEAQAYLDHYSDAPPSEFVNLRETGPVTMGCVFRVVPEVLLRESASLRQSFTARKSQWKLARLLGLRLIWDFARRDLSLNSVRKRVEMVLSCRVDVVSSVKPELAFDIDTPNDYSYASEHAR